MTCPNCRLKNQEITYLLDRIAYNVDYAKQVGRLERRLTELTEASIKERIEHGEDVKSDEGPGRRVERAIQRHGGRTCDRSAMSETGHSASETRETKKGDRRPGTDSSQTTEATTAK